ncbi:MAG: 16S rRNA (cytidine(1402)-2'-O)-methyltransferase [Caldithrix sp.]|nr:16S rRNA (cytidine(1402)-2'-O)-methyltransferase [Caldithrix sp.]
MVATPIGNLADLSHRSEHILHNVDLIAAEDTRTSGVLLKHYDIQTPMTSYHSHNLKKETPKLVQKMKNEQSVALISDAGTPGISDPGFHLVQAAITHDIRVIPIPGASAFLAALSASGLPNNRFVYEGFLPLKKGRQTRLIQLAEEERTIILYESPHRIHRTVRDLLGYLGDRPVVLGRELTKKFEEFRRGTLAELDRAIEHQKVKGELVIIVAGSSYKKGMTYVG